MNIVNINIEEFFTDVFLEQNLYTKIQILSISKMFFESQKYHESKVSYNSYKELKTKLNNICLELLEINEDTNFLLKDEISNKICKVEDLIYEAENLIYECIEEIDNIDNETEKH